MTGSLSGAPSGRSGPPTTVRIVTEGRNRIVLLAWRYAIKLPSPRSWRDFLFGLLNNMNEASWHRQHRLYCPVLWAAPLGLMIVMPRAAPVTAGEWDDVMFDVATWRPGAPAGVELKPSSWGWLAGELVAVDYGWR